MNVRVPSSFRSLLQNIDSRQNSALQFRTGQIFYGKVQSLFPHQHAAIQLGSHKMIAKLEVPLSTGKGYWLQVTSLDGETKLRLLNHSGLHHESNGSPDTLLRQLSLPADRISQAVANFFMKEQIPFTKDDILRAIQLLNESNHEKLGLDTIKWMMDRKIPLNREIFQSIHAVGKNNPETSLFDLLHTALLKESSNSKAGRELLTYIEHFIEGTENNQDKSALRQILKHSISQSGIFYENMLLNGQVQREETSGMLKPLLVKYMQETETSQTHSKTLASQLLYRMNGHQIMSLDYHPIQQLIFEIPLNLFGFQTELTMQWEGIWTKEGQINADFCRILFYLELEYLKETLIDVNVQNRIVNIQIINENKHINRLADILIPTLKAELQNLGYRLSTVDFKQPVEKEQTQAQNLNPYLNNRVYTGVDIKV